MWLNLLLAGLCLPGTALEPRQEHFWVSGSEAVTVARAHRLPTVAKDFRKGRQGKERFSMLKGGHVQCKPQADQFCTAFKVLSHLRNMHKGQNH